MELVETKELTSKVRIPGVSFKTSFDEDFYVDVAWAMAIENRNELNRILELNKEDFIKDSWERYMSSYLMRGSYTLMKHILNEKEGWRVNNSDKLNWFGKVVNFYYHTLSPKVVNFQLDHPNINRSVRNFTEFLLKNYLNFKKIELLDEKGVMEAKLSVRNLKDVSTYYITR